MSKTTLVKYSYSLNGEVLFQSDDPIQFYYFLKLNPEIANTVLLDYCEKLPHYKLEQWSDKKIAVEINTK